MDDFGVALFQETTICLRWGETGEPPGNLLILCAAYDFSSLAAVGWSHWRKLMFILFWRSQLQRHRTAHVNICSGLWIVKVAEAVLIKLRSCQLTSFGIFKQRRELLPTRRLPHGATLCRQRPAWEWRSMGMIRYDAPKMGRKSPLSFAALTRHRNNAPILRNGPSSSRCTRSSRARWINNTLFFMNVNPGLINS